MGEVCVRGVGGGWKVANDAALRKLYTMIYIFVFS